MARGFPPEPEVTQPDLQSPLLTGGQRRAAARPNEEKLYGVAAFKWIIAVSDLEQQLRVVLATLEDCRKALIEGQADETADLLSLAILDLRMKIHAVAPTELRALCDEMLRDARDGDAPPLAPAEQGRPLLRLVK